MKSVQHIPQRKSPPVNGMNAEMKLYAAAGITAVTIAAVLAAPIPPALAETMLIVGGTNATPWLPSPGGGEFSPTRIGSGFRPDAHITVIDYPASAWPISGLNTRTVGQSVALGTDNLDAAIRAQFAANPAEPVVVAGASQGSLVMDAVQARYANDPSAPPPGAVTFIVFGAPQTGPNGVTRRLPKGAYVPLLDLTVHRPVESQYNTVVVVGEYDFWADFPDRPWNLIAVANALFGAQYAHAQSALAGPSDVPPENVTATTNSKGGTVTTYLVPTDPLPLTRPLRDIGAPGEWVDRIDAVLKPIVDAGYARNDRKPTVAEPEPQSIPAPGPRDRAELKPPFGAARPRNDSKPAEPDAEAQQADLPTDGRDTRHEPNRADDERKARDEQRDTPHPRLRLPGRPSTIQSSAAAQIDRVYSSKTTNQRRKMTAYSQGPASINHARRRPMKTMGDALPRRRGRWQSPGSAGLTGQCEAPNIETRELP